MEFESRFLPLSYLSIDRWESYLFLENRLAWLGWYWFYLGISWFLTLSKTFDPLKLLATSSNVVPGYSLNSLFLSLCSISLILAYNTAFVCSYLFEFVLFLILNARTCFLMKASCTASKLARGGPPPLISSWCSYSRLDRWCRSADDCCWWCFSWDLRKKLA